ncbi:MAG: ATP-binding cassette domain-containing protein [Acholeplasmatales bacterium]|nr:ATP-binding cassette domain-containing protein [Acholeplasmatales bacterium]
MGILFDSVSHRYRGLKKKDVFTALENINLNINEKNEFIALVGRTGAGKSTLLQHMNGLRLPTEGIVDVFGYKITPKKRKNPKLKDVRRKIGYVFQFPEYQLFEETVLKDIMFGPLNFGYKKEEAEKRALEIMDLLKISDLKDKSPFNLSGGQMRRVAIAGVLAYDPDIILLDEPTRGLDPKGAIETMELFEEIRQKTNKTLIMITHDMDIVYEYATRVIILKDGHITYDGNRLDLFKDDTYKDNYLVKPEVLKLIDYLNEKNNYNICYDDIYNLDDLIKKLEKM